MENNDNKDIKNTNNNDGKKDRSFLSILACILLDVMAAITFCIPAVYGIMKGKEMYRVFFDFDRMHPIEILFLPFYAIIPLLYIIGGIFLTVVLFILTISIHNIIKRKRIDAINASINNNEKLQDK